LIPLETNGQVHKIAIPLKTGSCIFTISSQNTVQDLINTIHEEDYSADITVFSQGHKVAFSTPLRDILGDGFAVNVSGESYQVPATKAIGTFDGFQGSADANVILEKETFNRIRIRLKDEVRTTIPISEFLQICQEFDVSESDAIDLLRCFHHAGIILNFHQNKFLKDVVFLHPREVTGQVLKALEIPSTLAVDIDQRIHEVDAELLPLEQVKAGIDRKALEYATRSLSLGFGLLIVQFGFLFRLVWFDLGWDVMEPVAYFIGFGTTIGCYVCYSFTGRDSAFPDLWSFIIAKRTNKLKPAENFDDQKYQALLNERESLFLQKDKSQMISKLI